MSWQLLRHLFNTHSMCKKRHKSLSIWQWLNSLIVWALCHILLILSSHLLRIASLFKPFYICYNVYCCSSSIACQTAWSHMPQNLTDTCKSSSLLVASSSFKKYFLSTNKAAGLPKSSSLQSEGTNWVQTQTVMKFTEMVPFWRVPQKLLIFAWDSRLYTRVLELLRCTSLVMFVHCMPQELTPEAAYWQASRLKEFTPGTT